jgi:hypothetical protein
MGWTEAPRSRGWVGVGASWADEEEERRIREEAAWNPQRRWDQLAAERERDPVLGGLHTALAPLEPLNAGFEYVAGLGQGVAQAVMERYGADPFGRLGQLQTEARTRPWADVPVLGGLAQGAEVATRANAELATAPLRWGYDEASGNVHPMTLPASLRRMPHELGDEASRLDPETRNIFDPAEAVARFRALTPEPAQFGLQMMAGLGAGAVTKPVMGALKLGSEAGGVKGALGPGNPEWGVLEGKPLLDPRTGSPSVMDRVLAGAVSDPAKLAALPGLPLAAGVAAANPLDTEMDPFTRGARFAEGALAGLALGATAAGAQNAMQNVWKITGHFEPVPGNPNRRPVGDLMQQKLAQDQKEGYYTDVPRPGPMAGAPEDALVPARYPIGKMGNASGNLWLALQRTKLSDPFAMLEDITNSLFGLAERRGIAMGEDENLIGQARVLGGTAEKVKEWIQEGIPTWASGATTSVMGIKPILARVGVRNEAHLRDYDDLVMGKIALSRATRTVKKEVLDPTTGLGTGVWEDVVDPLDNGTLGKDPDTIREYIQNQVDLINDRHNNGRPGLGEQWAASTEDTTKFYNALGDYYAEAGMFNAEKWQAAKERYETPGFIRAHAEQFDAIWRRRELPANPISPTTQGLGKAYSQDDPNQVLTYSTTEMIKHHAKLINLADQNRFMQKVDATAQMFPEELGSIWRRQPSVQSHVPDRWRQVQFFDDGVPQAVLTIEPMADMMRGINVEAADAVTTAAAKLSNVFRKGVTVWNPSFILGNMPRDFMHASVNTGMPLEIMRQYVPAMASVFTKDVDNWFMTHQGDPGVARLPETIWQSLRDVVLKPVFGAAPEDVTRFNLAGGGMSSMTQVMAGPQTAEKLLGIPKAPTGLFDQAAKTAGVTIHSVSDFLEAASNLTEMTTRLAVFRAAGSQGATPFGAALTAREATVDYNKAGTAMRLFNLWAPLLNARTQGTLRTARAARDDPFGFATTMMAMAGMPQVLSYAWNRTMFPDLYEQIPTEERLRNHIVMFGSITDDQDQVKPAYFRIPKDSTVALFTVPIEHIMDSIWHTRHHGQPLEPNQRTDESTSYMAWRALGSLLPTDNFPNELTNPLAFATSVLTMNPLANTAVGLKSNEDPFRRTPLVPDEQMVLPPEYRYGPQTPDAYKAFSHAATGLFQKMGFDTSGMDWLAPAQLQFATRSMGGNLPDYLAQQLDVAIPKLQEIGLVEPGAFKPQSLADLGLPPGTPKAVSDLYFAKLEAQDERPLYMRLLNRFVGASARAGSMQERASHLGPREQAQAEQTQGFNRAYQNFLVDWRQRVAALDQAPDVPHQTKLERMQRLNAERQGAYKTLQEDPHYALAITDQHALRDFQAQLPGIGSEWMQQELPALPPGWTGEKIAAYLAAPPGRDLATLNPGQRYQAQRQALNTLSQQLQQPVNVLEMYAGYHKIGAEVPAVAVPNLAIEDAVNRYMNPTDHNKQPLDTLTAPGHLVRQAQDAVIQEIAMEWHVPPEQVEATLNTRTIGNPMELTDDGVSRLRGTMLWRRLHDPQLFPDYVNPDGAALGDEAVWAAMDVQIAQARQQFNGRLPPQMAQWDAAKKLGEQRRIQALATADPVLLGPLPALAIADHDRWYGTGRQMTTRQWAAYQSGAFARYTQGTPQDWATWDTMQKLYAATPAGPQKAQMRNQIRTIRRLQTPGWRAILQQDQLAREAELEEDA